MNVILLTFFIVYNTQHFDDSKGFNKLNKGWVFICRLLIAAAFIER